MQHKFRWLVGAFVVAMLVGFSANPSPQPQRVADLVARLEALEEENLAQQDVLDALSARVDALEALGGETSGILLDDDVTIPDDWEEDDSSDGVVRYLYDPSWELANDEPGTMDLWMDEDTAIFFSWDWSFDLLDNLHDDEDFFRVFEGDLVWSDETIKMDVENSGPVEFMGEEAHFWEIRVESIDGYASRMLSIFYPCSDRTSCNITFVRFDPDPEDKERVAAFNTADWAFVHTFANGVEFLSDGKASVTANANLRACAAIDCEIVGRLVRGEIVELVAVSEDGAWFQLKSGEWISSALVFGAPVDLPVINGNEEI